MKKIQLIAAGVAILSMVFSCCWAYGNNSAAQEGALPIMPGGNIRLPVNNIVPPDGATFSFPTVIVDIDYVAKTVVITNLETNTIIFEGTVEEARQQKVLGQIRQLQKDGEIIQINLKIPAPLDDPDNPFTHEGYGDQCTAFVTEVYYALGVGIPSLDNANTWDDNAGYPVSTYPMPGDIAVWETTPGNSAGHVAVVTSVSADGTITVMEQNVEGPGIISTRTLTPKQYRGVHFVHTGASIKGVVYNITIDTPAQTDAEIGEEEAKPELPAPPHIPKVHVPLHIGDQVLLPDTTIYTVKAGDSFGSITALYLKTHPDAGLYKDVYKQILELNGVSTEK